ncbi:transposase family protein, partial [Streptomyces sp. NPDC006527]|uniref:transposase family protein n=1 Tax=Streptomyces sp. NPDC006527 TaxID=3364749 RepID=UPI0036B7BDD1
MTCSWSCFRTCPYLSALLIEEVERQPDQVVLRTRVRATTGSCWCGQSSARVHGQYVRRLRDVSVGGLGVVIELCVRRFRCENPACMAVTFAERVSGLTTPHSRHTPLLREVLTQIGLALAGRAGARLASAVGLTIGKDTLLRLAAGQVPARAGDRQGGDPRRRRLRLPRGPPLRHGIDRHGHPPAAAPLRRPRRRGSGCL